MIYEFDGAMPDTKRAAFIAQNATIIGNVHLGEDTGVWFGAVIRADVAEITIGDRSNVQDNAVLHVDSTLDMTIGNDVTIGHSAVVHSAHIEDGALIGMHATVLNGAHIGKNSIIGAGALVKENDVIPDNSLAVGVPAKVVKSLGDDSVRASRQNSEHYVALAKLWNH